MTNCEAPVVRKWYDRTRQPFATEGESLTKQADKKSADINHIMARYEKTGLIEHVNRFEGSYGDYMEIPEDYQGCIDMVREAQEMFQTVPSRIRAEFDNDPGQFLAFVSDPENREAMGEMGLLPKSPPVSPPAEQNDGPQGRRSKEPAKAPETPAEGEKGKPAA